MVNRVVPAADLMDAATEYADYLCRLPEHVLEGALAALRANSRIFRPEVVAKGGTQMRRS